jgi:hypothetical protein
MLLSAMSTTSRENRTIGGRGFVPADWGLEVESATLQAIPMLIGQLGNFALQAKHSPSRRELGTNSPRNTTERCAPMSAQIGPSERSLAISTRSYLMSLLMMSTTTYLVY